MNFLGVKVDEISKEQALQKVSEFLSSSSQHKIFTPNPEFVVKAQKDEYFKKILNSGDLNLCDGYGLELAMRFFTRPNCHPEQSEGSLSGVERDSSHPFRMTKKIERIPGVDFMLEVCKLAEEQKKGIYLLGSGNDDVVRQACEQLHKKFPNLKISGYNKGPELREGCHSEQSEESLSVGLVGKRSFTSVQDDSMIIEEINKTGAEVLFVAFGMGKQEKWIYENLSKMPNVKVAMGVGGSFEFISGKIKRAPLFMRQLGLEWVYRLAQQPRRIGRIFNATVKFSWLVLLAKIKQNEKSA